MTGRGDVLHDRQRARAADQQSHVAPGFVHVQTVHRVATRDAGLAAAATVEIDLETVLLARPRRGGWHERAIVFLADRRRVRVVIAGKLFHRRHVVLLLEQQFDKRGSGAGCGRTRVGSTSVVRGHGDDRKRSHVLTGTAA